MSNNPLLRPLDFQPVIYQDQQMWLIRDPLGLDEAQLIMSPALAQLLVYMDGTRNPAEIQQAFYQDYGTLIDMHVVQDTIARLDEACLLDNPRSSNAIQDRLQAYRAQSNRPPSLAGNGYPADPEELKETLIGYGREDTLNGWGAWHGRGIISPHIDYMRGGPVYARVWRRAKAAVKKADLVLIFGTDHNGSTGSITLTQQPYATPYGVLPTDLTLIRALGDDVGPQLFAEELHHQNEHSVELSAVWFHHIRGRDTCPVVPILCGSFHHFIAGDQHPDDDPLITSFVETLQAKTAGKRVLAVASVDLAHVGPSFGDDFIMDAERRATLTRNDASLMDAIKKGDVARFYGEVAASGDRNRICGFSSIYLMMRFLGSTNGRQVAYQHCPADMEDASLVSICGMLLS